MKSLRWKQIAGAVTILILWAGLRMAALDRPFWMDESFSASLAFQPPDTIVDVCAKDVHPPLYYLALRGWNELCLMVAGDRDRESKWTLEDFNLRQLETAGTFDWRGADGELKHTAGVFPDTPIYWADVPLAPLWGLRLFTILCSLGSLVFLFLLAGLFWPERPEIAWGAAALFAVSGYAATWDTIIRSYSPAAAFCLALAYVCFRGARDGRWRLVAPWIATCAVAAFLTHYAAQLLFPAIAFGAWMMAGWKKRAFGWLFGSFAAAGVVILLLWGQSYFGQFGRLPDRDWLSRPISQGVFEELDDIILNYWRLLFTEGIWRWLFGIDPHDRLNPLQALSPTQPILYMIAFALYITALGTNITKFVLFRANRSLLAVAIVAFFPALVMLIGNTLKPAFFRLHARHFYPLAPFFYLFLVAGWSEAGRVIRGRLSRRK